jgi:hypothetical protein
MERFLTLVFLFAYPVALIVPVTRIFKRVGINPWLSILAIVPLVNLAGLWLFAFSPWPSDPDPGEPAAEWSDADKEKFRQLMREQQ